MAHINLGPAGSAGLGNEEGLKEAKRLGLNSLEVEFTYGVRMKNEEAKRIGQLAKELGIGLSVHGPYYINLNSAEKAKVEASKKRILESCERAHHLGARYVVFHAAFYGKDDKEKVYQKVKEEILDLQKTIKHNKWDVQLAPETTGKGSQFGNVDELLRLVKETGCHLCVDFAHIKARNNGRIDYEELFDKLKPIKHIHAHFSGIEWTEKGERRHIITDKKVLKELIDAIKKAKADVTIINESPDPFGDSVKAKELA